MGVVVGNIQQHPPDETAFTVWVHAEQHPPDETAFTFRAHAAPSGECNYYIQEVCNLSRPFPQFSENRHHDIIMTPTHSLPMQDVGVVGYF